MALALTGCAVGPEFQQPDPPPVQGYLPGQHITRSTDVAGRWWRAFGSPALNQLIEDALQNNADLAAAEAAVRVTQALARAQRSTLFPTVGGSFNATHQRVATESTTSNSPTGSDIYSLHTAQLSVSFVPDVFGGTRRAIEAAEAQVEVARFQRDAVLLTLTTNIANAAVTEASLRGQIAVTRRLIAVQTQLLGVLAKQEAAGQIALTDVVSQRTALAQARALLPPLEKQLEQQRNLLATLSGRYAAEGAGRAFDFRALRLPRGLPMSLPAQLVRQRPDILAAEANMRVSNAQIGVAMANRLPQVSLTAQAGSSASAFSKLFGAGTGFWGLTGNVLQTLFDAGNLAARQTAAEETFTQSMAQYRAVVLVAFQNVADVLRAQQADARALAAAIAAEQSAAQGLELVRKQLELGQVSQPIVLAAQQAYLQTATARVQAQAMRLSDAVALFQALGGGWWNRPAFSPKAKQESPFPPLPDPRDPA